MGAAKWIGGIIGFMAGGPLGALAGYALGSIFEGSGSSSQDGATGGYSHSERGYGAAQGERNSFLFSLLVMASYIIKADGKVMHSEMEFVRQFLRQNFGMQLQPRASRFCSTSSNAANRWTASTPTPSARPSANVAHR